MALFMNENFESLDDLLIAQLRDLYDAEKRLTKALPEMVDAATNDQLKSAIQNHLSETQGHVSRLERIFGLLGTEVKSNTCEAMKGLLKEGEEMMSAKGNMDVRDAALIAAAQRVEHYEIAGYGTARTFAERLGHAEVAQLLQTTLDEEGAADRKLTQLAEQTINWKASAAAARAR